MGKRLAVFLACALVAASAATTVAAAAGKMPISPGTYAQKREWCGVDRQSPSSPDNRIEGAFINIEPKRILISEGIADIRAVSVKGNDVTLTVDYSLEGDESRMELKFLRKSPTAFVYRGQLYTKCKRNLPNPWFG